MAIAPEVRFTIVEIDGAEKTEDDAAIDESGSPRSVMQADPHTRGALRGRFEGRGAKKKERDQNR